MGTDYIRTVYPDFWVEYVYKIISVFEDEWDYVLIPDTRFLNEIEYFSKMNFPHRVVRIERQNHNSGLTKEQLNHPSETSLDFYDFDVIFYNNKSLEDLKKSVRLFVKEKIINSEASNE